MKFMQYTLSIAMLIMMSNAWVANGKTVPLAGGSNGIAEFSLVPMHRIRARLKLVANVDDGKPAIVVTFTKYGDERRLLALEARLKDKLSDVRAIAIRYRIKSSRGKSPRLAVLFFDADGGIWFKRSANPLIIGKFTDMRLPVSRLRQVAFSDDPSGKVEFDKVDKVWLGLLF
ncbi:MAG TPA: hypothetical protein EYP10_06205, partial [Armatimonadetes bacterium]|nr:hypothetical protein [Armatimonadota bacterium]